MRGRGDDAVQRPGRLHRHLLVSDASAGRVDAAGALHRVRCVLRPARRLQGACVCACVCVCVFFARACLFQSFVCTHVYLRAMCVCVCAHVREGLCETARVKQCVSV